MDDTIFEVKCKIECKKNGVHHPPGRMRLEFAGRILDNTRTVAQYHIMKESTLHVLLELGVLPPPRKVSEMATAVARLPPSVAELRRTAFVEMNTSTAAYQAVVSNWERNKRIIWPVCDLALRLALVHRESRATLAFLNQMVPVIVKTCMDCPWAKVVKNVDTMKDDTNAFASILHSFLEICLGTVQQGSIDMMPLLTMLLDPMAQLYSKHDTNCPPSQTLLPSLKHHACSLGGPAQVLARLQDLPWTSMLSGVRFLHMCHEDVTHVTLFGQALGVLKQRILARGFDEDGTTLASLELAKVTRLWTLPSSSAAAESIIEGGSVGGGRLKRSAAFWLDGCCSVGACKRTKMSSVPAPPPGYWTSNSNVTAAGSSSVVSMCHEFDVVPTKFMRGKLEYVLNKCAEHTGGCGRECVPFSNIRVVQVDRVENQPLWERFAASRANQTEQCGKNWVEESRPINCDVGNDEQFLFHGTSPKAVEKIIVDGFKMGAKDTSRYGRGIYFTDESCKAHQYSDRRFILQEDGSKLYCMLYCRVATRKALTFSVTEDLRKRGFLGGMIKPTPCDPIFRSRLPDWFSSRLAFDSLVVLPDKEHQIHREIIVYDSDQVYPEFVVWYKIASESAKKTSFNVHDHEQLQASIQKCRANALSYSDLQYAVNPVSQALARQKYSEMSAMSVKNLPQSILGQPPVEQSTFAGAIALSNGASPAISGGSKEKRMDHVDPLNQLGVGPGLRQGWDDMPRGCVFLEVPIYSIHSAIPGGREAAGVLAAAFQTCVKSPVPSHAQALACIQERSNYQVVEIVRVQNIARASMHDTFKRVYAVGPTLTVYHGTTGASATTISETGFRRACSQRSKLGKGIYTSSNIWEALAYAEPAPDLTQTFLVVNLLQGPTALGQVEMVDFGSDSAGNQILTVTNPENTTFCASLCDQLLATYRVSVRFDSSTKHTPAQQNLIRMYHPTIWELIQRQTLPPPPTPPLFLLPNLTTPFTTVATATPTTRTYETSKIVHEKTIAYAGIHVGDRVAIQNSFHLHKFCDGKEGFVRDIVKDGTIFLCVEIVDVPEMATLIAEANKRDKKPAYPHVDMGWVRCKQFQVMKI